MMHYKTFFFETPIGLLHIKLTGKKERKIITTFLPFCSNYFPFFPICLPLNDLDNPMITDIYVQVRWVQKRWHKKCD